MAKKGGKTKKTNNTKSCRMFDGKKVCSKAQYKRMVNKKKRQGEADKRKSKRKGKQEERQEVRKKKKEVVLQPSFTSKSKNPRFL